MTETGSQNGSLGALGGPLLVFGGASVLPIYAKMSTYKKPS